MQLLHIADLHFGRLLYGRSLMDDQRHFVRQSLLPALDAYKPDALLIAGDLYDLSLIHILRAAVRFVLKVCPFRRSAL